MIAKQLPMNNKNKSSFTRLVNYLTNNQPGKNQEKEVRVDGIAITNCLNPDSIEWAMQEIQMTQDMNKRAKSDKTYHLLISFPKGEKLEHEQLWEIEDRICKDLGFGEHQRISAIHIDTDNLHIHVGINKIHPTKYTIFEPYQDYKTLAKSCEAIEIEYGLIKTNHQAQQSVGQSKANDMEKIAGVESLITWIKDSCSNDLIAAKDWNEFNNILNSHGLVIKERGNGFVFQDKKTEITVKASSIDRQLSKPNLLNKYGNPPIPLNNKNTKTTNQYSKRPINRKIDTSLLYEKYKAERNFNYSSRNEYRSQLNKRKQAEILAAKNAAKDQRAIARMSKGGIRFLTRKTINIRLKQRLDEIHKKYNNELNSLNDRTRLMSWNDWLRVRAEQGDAEALEVLRAAKSKEQKTNNSIYSKGNKNNSNQSSNLKVDSVSRRGTLIYGDSTGIRDDGEKITIYNKTEDANLEKALILAAEKYGKNLNIKGDLKFKQQVVRVAANFNLDITFDDPLMEKHRLDLYDKRVSNERRESRRNSNGHRGHGRGSAGGAGFLYDKSNLSAVRREAATRPTNSVHELPGINVVSPEGRNKMFLSDDAHHQLDEQRAKSNIDMRRSVSSRTAINIQLTAMNKYIHERNAKHASGINVPIHKAFTAELAGESKFVGVRNVDGVDMGLFEKDGVVYVKDVDKSEVGRLKSISKNNTVSIDSNGKITVGKTKGVKR